MEAITIQVDSEIAKAFREAAPDEQQRIQLLLNAWLKQTMKGRSLNEIIDDMQAQARANGLTQETLNMLLQDD